VAPAIFGNWFSPFSLRQVFEAAITSLKTISLAVDGNNASLTRLAVLSRKITARLPFGN